MRNKQLIGEIRYNKTKGVFVTIPILIKDLGMQYPQEKSKRKVHYGIYECPKCHNHYRARDYQIRRGTSSGCRKCANRYTSSDDNRFKFNNLPIHGLSRHPLYPVWSEMKSRCSNMKNKSYIYYGAKGVTVCEEWVNDPKAFINWAESNGWRKGLEIDKDILSREKNISPAIYSPDTCTILSHRENINARDF